MKCAVRGDDRSHGRLEERLQYRFTDSLLLERALTHGSSSEGKGSDYDRLEFLGDAVLELITREYLLDVFPDDSEGMLTKKKIVVVQRRNLAAQGFRLGLDEFVRLGKGFDRSSKALQSVTADVLEAIIGAIYLDSGLEAAKEFTTREILTSSRANYLSARSDARSLLQEYCQARVLELPQYRLISRTGPDNDPMFTVTVLIDGMDTGTGAGSTLKKAREAAAAAALKKIERKA